MPLPPLLDFFQNGAAVSLDKQDSKGEKRSGQVVVHGSVLLRGHEPQATYKGVKRSSNCANPMSSAKPQDIEAFP
jgi:hypothetical protein